MPFGNEGHEDAPSALLFPNRRGLLKMVGIAGAAGITGAGSVGAQETQTERTVQGEWVSGTATDAQTLNPIQISDAESAARVGPTMDGAYALTPPPETEVFPLWADISTEDSKTYTVTLRDNLQWSEDYGQMTAEDWVYFINNVIEAEDNWAGYTEQDEWRRNGEFVPVEQTGELTFDIKLPEVDPAYPLRPIMWGHQVMPKGLIEKYAPDKDLEGLQQDEEVQTLAYTGNLGPYTFEKWEREAEFVATRNEDYYMRDVEDSNIPIPEKYDAEAWQGAPYFNSQIIKVIPEESTRLAALRTGEVTTTGIPEPKVEQFQGRDDVNVNVAPQPFNTLLIYNRRANGWGPFRNVEVRRALAYAVNKQAIVENILRGLANVAQTFQPKFSEFFDDSQVEEFGVGDSYDPEKARNDLAAALEGTDYGYDGDTLTEPDGNPVTLKMAWAVGSQTTETTVQFIKQEYANNLGINVELEGVQFNTLLDKYVRNSFQGEGEPEFTGGPFNAGPRDQAVSENEWDLMYGIRFNTFPLTPSDTRGFWEETGSTNYYGYVPEADISSLYDQAVSETDGQRRQELFAEIFGVLSEEQANNFIEMSSSISGYRDKVAIEGDLGPDEVFNDGWDSNIWHFKQE